MLITIYKQVSQYNYTLDDPIEIFQSLSVTENFTTHNEFSLTLPASNHIKTLVPDAILKIDGVLYFVDTAIVEDDSPEKLTVSGLSLMGWLQKKIIRKNWIQTGKPEKIAYDILNQMIITTDSKFKIPLFSLGSLPSITANSIQYQNSYGAILEEIETLCDTYNFGFREVALSDYYPTTRIDFYGGQDVSDQVVFKKSFQNLLTESYQNIIEDEATVAYVFGEGEGSYRKFVIVNDNLTGADRKEIYVDARDLKQESEETIMTDAQYIEALRNRGLAKLAEQQRILLVNGQININDELYEYKKDYDLGDLVTIVSEKFGLSKKAQLTSVTRTWDEHGYHIDPIFGKEAPTIIEKLKRK